MERREFIIAETWMYVLTARGFPEQLKRALDFVEHLIKTNETQPLRGIIEVEDIMVTIKASYQGV